MRSCGCERRSSGCGVAIEPFQAAGAGKAVGCATLHTCVGGSRGRKQPPYSLDASCRQERGQGVRKLPRRPFIARAGGTNGPRAVGETVVPRPPSMVVACACRACGRVRQESASLATQNVCFWEDSCYKRRAFSKARENHPAPFGDAGGAAPSVSAGPGFLGGTRC